jgi:hypothetical protein
MTTLGSALHNAGHHADAASVREADFRIRERFNDSESNILIAQGNLATTYYELGRLEEASRMLRHVYFGYLKLNGKEDETTLRMANNYAESLGGDLQRFKEAKTLLLKAMPVARRVLGEGDVTTLRMGVNYAMALYVDTSATLDDLREAVRTLEDTERTARRVLGGSHPDTRGVENNLRCAREATEKRLEAMSYLLYAAAALTVAALLV